MRRFIICPEIYRNRWTDFYRIFFDHISSELNFQIIYTNKAPGMVDPDIIFLFAIPQHDRPGMFYNWIMSLPKKTKVISYMRDLHTFDNKRFELEVEKLFTRFDLIISPAHEFFVNTYPQFQSKMKFMPDFFGPDSRYRLLHIQKDPINKCLMSGACVPQFYPIRGYILYHGDGQRIFHIPPPYPTCPHDFIGDKYARLLNKFECCVTESGIYKYAVTKVFEIPAAGSLLVCNTVQDMEMAGFIPNVHYVPITKENSLETIYKVLDNPGKYEKIKKDGRDFVLQVHSLNNRVDFVKSIIHEGL